MEIDGRKRDMTEVIARNYKRLNLDALVCLGGGGTQKNALRLAEKGLNIIAMKMLRVTPALAKQHYAEHVQKPFYPGLEKFITASPILAMVVEGLEVIRVVREMLGATSGLKAAARTTITLT